MNTSYKADGENPIDPVKIRSYSLIADLKLSRKTRTVKYEHLPFDPEEVLEKFENYLDFSYEDE